MQPKKAITIIIIMFVIAALSLFYLYSRQNNLGLEEANQADEQALENGGQEAEREELINKRIEEIRQELEGRSEEEIKTQGYTQDEVDFILNPRGTVEKELGVEPEEEGQSQPLSQEEIDAILNP